MGLSIRIFRNFRTVFEQSKLNFQDSFQTVLAEFLGLFLDRPDMIFETVFRLSGTVLRFSFNLGTDVFGFCDVFWYHSNSVTNHEGTKKCHVLYGFEIWVILCVLLEK